MADFTALKTAIQTYIKQNGNEEITGNILQEVLLAMVQTMGDGAINDLVTALSNEVTARQNADGTLQTNINNEATARGNADTALGGRLTTVEGAITAINTKLSEGYVYSGIATPSTNPSAPIGKVFYIATAAGTYTNFLDGESHPLVITNGINIIKSNGTYWTIEHVLAIDSVPTGGSSNLAKSGGIFAKINDVESYSIPYINMPCFPYFIINDAFNPLGNHKVVKVSGGETVKIKRGIDNIYIAFVKSYNIYANGSDAITDFATGETGTHYISGADYLWTFNLPEDTRYILLGNNEGHGDDRTPSLFMIDDYDVLKGARTQISELNRDKITLDETPTKGSDNGVKSGGVYDFTNRTTVNVFDFGDVENAYISDLGVIITSGVAPSYMLAKFTIDEAADYVVSTQGNTHPIFAKYNEDYSVLDAIMIQSGSDICVKMHLDAGYYALCWNTMVGTIKDNYVSKSYPLLKAVDSLGNNPFVTIGADKFAVSGSSTKVGDVFTINGGGSTNKVYLNGRFECAKKRIGANFISTHTPEVRIGFVNNMFVRITNANNVCTSTLYEFSGSEIPGLSHAFSFALQKNVGYQIIVDFEDANAYKNIHIHISDEFGVGEDYSYIGVDVVGHGTPCFMSSTVMTMTKPFITNQYYYDVREMKAAIWGHSFVEAWTIRDQRNKSFSNLIAQEIGEKKFMICGFGGDDLQDVYSNIRGTIDFAKNIKYALICAGVNDTTITLDQYKERIITIIRYLWKYGITAILFTIEPNVDGYGSNQFPLINEWIRSSGYLYVDMDKVFYNADGTINTSIYIDRQHPTIEGHQRIANRIKYDCPFLF